MTHIVYLPPATGFTQAIQMEATFFASRGASIHLFTFEQSFVNGFTDPHAVHECWEQNFQAWKRFLKDKKIHSKNCILIGFNQGGTQAAFLSMQCEVKALVCAGSIPLLSVFWSRSSYPVALAARGKVGHKIHSQYLEVMGKLDLGNSLQNVRAPTLIQFGKQDPWLDEFQRNYISQWHPAGNIALAHTEDDHEMVNEETQSVRREFVLSCLDRIES